MDYFTEASRLVAFVGAYTENPDLALDRDGRCAAEIEGIRFSFFYEAEFEALFIQAALGAPTPGAFEALMLSNQLWEGTAGGIFGLNSEDGNIYYSYRLDFPLAEEPVYEAFLCELLAGIVGAIEAAMDDIKSGHPNLPTASDGFNPVNAV